MPKWFPKRFNQWFAILEKKEWLHVINGFFFFIFLHYFLTLSVAEVCMNLIISKNHTPHLYMKSFWGFTVNDFTQKPNCICLENVNRTKTIFSFRKNKTQPPSNIRSTKMKIIKQMPIVLKPNWITLFEAIIGSWSAEA